MQLEFLSLLQGNGSSFDSMQAGTDYSSRQIFGLTKPRVIFSVSTQWQMDFGNKATSSSVTTSKPYQLISKRYVPQLGQGEGREQGLHSSRGEKPLTKYVKPCPKGSCGGPQREGKAHFHSKRIESK